MNKSIQPNGTLMKKIISSSFAASLCLFVSAITVNSARAEHIQLPERVFAPVGFDNNDNASVVLYGHFPDTCYHAGPARFTIRGNEIRIRNLGLHQGAGSCLKAPVPWATTVNFGPLSPGKYSVLLEGPDAQMTHFVNLIVHPSLSRNGDNYEYAYVNGAIMNRSTRGATLTMSGTFSLTCMEIAEVRVKETNGVIVVLPIIRLRKDMTCGYPFAPIPFTKRLKIFPKTDAPTLIHIRSMNGQALNQVFDY